MFEGKKAKDKDLSGDGNVTVSSFSRFTLNKWQRKYTVALLGLIIVLALIAVGTFWWAQRDINKQAHQGEPDTFEEQIPEFDPSVDSRERELSPDVTDESKASYYVGVAYLYVDEQNYTKALEYYTKVEELGYAEQLKIYNLIAEAHEQLGDMDKAEEYRQKAQDNDEIIDKQNGGEVDPIP